MEFEVKVKKNIDNCFEKVCCFPHRFLKYFALILEGLGGGFGRSWASLRDQKKGEKHLLKRVRRATRLLVYPKRLLGGFESLLGGFWEGFGSLYKLLGPFGSLLGRLWGVFG